MPKRRPNPFDVRLSAQARTDLGLWLADELDRALNARSTTDAQIEYFHTLYEQGRTRGGTNAPWPDAADLTSAIGTEKVDALRARIVRSIFTDQIWTVEGWGEAAARAPFVEEFHQWQAEVEGFQAVFAKAVHLSLIEPRGVIEVYEDRIRRPVRRQIRGLVATNPEGAAMLDAQGQPILQRDAQGKIQEAPAGGGLGVEATTSTEPPSAEVIVDEYELLSAGPRERVIPYRDFLILPGHARERSEIWGYAKRFWRRLDELAERVDQGVYDQAAVEALQTGDERASETTLAGEAKPVAPKEGDLAEKELWEVTCLTALAGSSLRWYVATLHMPSRRLLRLQYDDIGQPRYFSLIPFPRADSATEGYLFLGQKLITVIEENTAWRNMLADRAALQLQVPIKLLEGALWDPDEEPIGPKSTIRVRSMGELEPLVLPDLTAPARERIIDSERQAEKLAGVTDIASGVQPTHDRTLGETQLVAIGSEVRMDEVLHNLQEPLEEIAQVRHLMWQRALADMPDGLELPDSVLQGLETRGVDVTRYLGHRRLTASLLEGAFRFKPKGSVESADRSRQRRDFNESLAALAAISRANPMIGAILQQPTVARALLERWIQLYQVSDKQAFLGSEARNLLQPALPGGPSPGPPVPMASGAA